VNELIIFGAIIIGAVLSLPLWHFIASMRQLNNPTTNETDEHEQHYI